MAGIGFRLQRLLLKGTYTDTLKAYLYSSMIALGPLVVTVLTLALVKTVIKSRLSIEDGLLFQGLIVYAFGFSLLGTAPFLYVVTRFIADRYYLKDLASFTPTYLTMLEIVFALQGLVAAAFLYPLSLSFGLKLAVFALYLFINGIWLAMVFLSAARSFAWIVSAFVLGGVASVVLALWLGRTLALSGFLTGYALGHGMIFFLLSYRVFKEFGYSASADLGVLLYFRKFPRLVAIGTFYNLGIWIDKLIFWGAADAESVMGVIRFNSGYDTPMFAGFLTILPSMAFFLVQMETSFVWHFQGYYRAIAGRATYREIGQHRQAIMDNLTSNFEKFALFQSLVSGVVIIFIHAVAGAFGLDSQQIGVFRVAILGAYLQMAFIIVLNIMFYFDFQNDALFVTGLYCILNALGSWYTLTVGLPAYGFGYAAAGLVSSFAALMLLNYKLKRLDFYTFMKQPITLPKFKLEAEK